MLTSSDRLVEVRALESVVTSRDRHITPLSLRFIFIKSSSISRCLIFSKNIWTFDCRQFCDFIENIWRFVCGLVPHADATNPMASTRLDFLSCYGGKTLVWKNGSRWCHCLGKARTYYGLVGSFLLTKHVFRSHPPQKT